VIRSTTVALLLSTVALASPADAQVLPQPVAGVEAQASAPPAPTRRAPARSFFRAYAMFDTTELAAADSFNAVIGKSRITMPGGGVEVLGLWKGLFARGAFSSVTETGSRVVVFDDEVISLGIPVTIEMKPLEIAAGWRFRPLLSGRLTPYVGGGLLRMSYKETSDFAIGDENTDETFTGSVVFGGVEVALVSWVMAGAEVQYRSVPNALGGGVSEVFDESDLGGVTVRVLVGIRR
jgi:hypothetical protein